MVGIGKTPAQQSHPNPNNVMPAEAGIHL